MDRVQHLGVLARAIENAARWTPRFVADRTKKNGAPRGRRFVARSAL
jgi:hypothetical protein